MVVWFENSIVMKFFVHPDCPGFIKIDDVYRHNDNDQAQFHIQFDTICIIKINPEIRKKQYSSNLYYFSY